MLPDHLAGENHQRSLSFLSLLVKQGVKQAFIQENEESYKNCLADLQSKDFWTPEDQAKLQTITSTLIDSTDDVAINKIIEVSTKNQLVSINQSLHSAVKKNNLKKIQHLLDLGADINAADESGNPPFYYLIGKHKVDELIDFFLNHTKFDLHFNKFGYNEFLVRAFQTQDDETCLKLINKGVSSDAVSSRFAFAQDSAFSSLGKSRELLLEGFRAICIRNGLEDKKIQEHLYEFWINPMNRHNVCMSAGEWEKLLNALSSNPSFLGSFPNLFTLIIDQAIKSNVALEPIYKCLNAHPDLKTYHGKQLMYCAISNGNLPLVKDLVKRGTDPNALYGSPLSATHSFYSESTPLHHSILNQQKEIAEYLLHNKTAPVSINIRDGKNRTIFQELLDESDLLNDSLMVSWLIDQPEIDIEMKNEKGQTLLSIICANISTRARWPLIAKLLEKGASLDASIKNVLFNAALKQQQLSVASLLLDQARNGADLAFSVKTLIEGVKYDSLVALTEGINQGWVQEVLAYLISEGLKIDSTLLTHMIQSNNYPMAAFLISQGCSIDENTRQLLKMRGIDPQILMDYAENLKKGSRAEQALRRELFIKNLGHLLGDSFLRKMKSIEGQALEGNYPSVSLSFMCRILNLLNEKAINISQKTKEKLKTLSRQFEETIPLSLALEDILRMDPRDPDLPAAVKRVSDSIRKDLHNLKIGDRFLIPHGWSGFPAGHATMIVCRRASNGFIFDVINTGGGAKYHLSQRDQAKEYIDTVHSFFIPEESIETSPVIEQILTPKLLGFGAKAFPDRKFGAADLYLILQPYSLTDKQRKNLGVPLNSAWMGIQLSGTCSFCCLEATLAADMETDEYKIIIPFIKEIVLRMSFELNHDLLKTNPPLAKIMSESAPRFFTHVAKSIKRLPGSERTEGVLQEKAEHLERLKKFHQELKEKLPSHTSSNSSIPCSDQFPAKTNEVHQSLPIRIESKESTTFKSNQLKAVPLPSFDFSKIETAEQLADTLSTYADYLQKMKETKTPLDLSTAIFLRNLGRLFTRSSEQRLSALQSVLEKDPDLCMKALKDLEKITVHYFEETGKKNEADGSRLIALSSGLIIAWALSKAIDKTKEASATCSLDNYRLNIYLYKVQFNQTNQIHTPEMIEDWISLYIFIQKSGKNKNPILFEFDMHGQIHAGSSSNYHNVYLRKELGDYKYVQAHLPTIPEEEWKACDLAYEEQLKNYPNYEKVTPEEWKTNWLYVKGTLPEHFLYLRHIALMAHIESPYRNTQNRSAQFEFSGPMMVQELNTSAKRLMVTFSLDGERRIGPQAHLLLNPKSRNEENNLPIEKGSTQFRPESDQKPPYNFPYIQPFNQNTILTTTEHCFHDLVTLRTPYYDPYSSSSLSFSMLIDYFGNELQELAKPESRIIFDCCTNQFLRLRKLDAPLRNEFIDFLTRAIDHYYPLVLAGEDKQQSLQVLLFLYEQKQQVLRTFITNEKKEEAIQLLRKELVKIRQEVSNLSSLPDCNNPQDQQYLCLILLDSYNEERPLTKEDVIELVKTRAELTRLLLDSPQNPRLFPALWRSADLSIFCHRELIQKYLQEYPEVYLLFNQLLERLGINSQGGEWHEDAFPIYNCLLGDTSYQMNVLTGEVLKNGNAFSSIKTLTRQHLYQELFGNAFIVGTKTPEGIESQDKHGNIRFLTQEKYYGVELNAIHREIDHEWYEYISPRSTPYPLLPPLPNINNLQVWKSVRNEKPVYLLVDKFTMIPKYTLDDEGYFHFPYGEHSQRYEWVNLSSVKGMEGAVNFDSKAILWKPAPISAEESYPAILTFPSYRDEQGNGLNFQLKEGKWVSTASPHLHISQNQLMQEISGFSRFLVLEDSSGEKDVLIPLQTLGALKGDSSRGTCLLMKLENGQAASKVPAKNAFLAYLTMTHAITPQDYIVAMEYLKKAFSFERYSPEELRIFGWIFNCVKERADYSGSMDSIRLYAAWLVQTNLQRNPQLRQTTPPTNQSVSIPNLYAPAKDWEAYWENEWTWSRKGKTSNLSSQIDKLTRHYLPRNRNVPFQVKLENVLNPEVLIKWGFDQRTIGYSGITPPSSLAQEQGDLEIKTLDLFKVGRSTGSLSFHMRPGKEFAAHFPKLYRMAKSPKPADRQKVQNLISSMAYDTFEKNRALRLILQAALLIYTKDTDHQGYQTAQSLVNLMDEILVAVSQYSHDMDKRLVENNSLTRLNTLLALFNSQFSASKQLIGGEIWGVKAKEPAIIIPPHQRAEVPKEFPTIHKLVYKQTGNDLQEINQIYHDYFETQTRPSTSSQVCLFQFDTDDEFISNSIKELNEDYIEGNKKNDAVPIHTLKTEMEPNQAAQILKTKLGVMQKICQNQVKTLYDDMIRIANTPLENTEEHVLERAAILAGLKTTLGEKECIDLFLLGDLNEFKKKTHLTDEKAIQELYQIIGDYLCLSRKTMHIQDLLKEIKSLEDLLNPPKDAKTTKPMKQEDVDACLQKIGNGLIQIRYVDPQVDPNALIVLEYGLDLFLKKDQVEGLRQMIPNDQQVAFPNVLIQRIQGGGKTLIFGHTLARVKADGYHLSIHVAPTAQYGTALYDMQHISGKVFGQIEHTLEFDDNPLRFTEDYLTFMLNTMTTAIVNRDYITVTNDTLRAMRCKYIKTCLLISKKLAAANGVETAEIHELEKKNGILEEMLKLMRTRGVFTFDEVHQAFDPTKELNMPYGKISPINPRKAKLIGKIIAFAANAGSKEAPLLKLHENHQSQQTDAKYQAMISVVIDKFIHDPEIKETLGLSEDPTEKQQLENYLIGKEANLPLFIEEKGKENAELVVLAKQMIAGEWLKQRLGKSINEHLGFSAAQQILRIAIPYSGNDNPAEGSEFSDEYIMIINTLMTYIVLGFTQDQLKEFIDDLKKQAYRERLNKLEDNPSFALKDTSAAKLFQKVCGMDLFLINKEDPNTLENINKSLLAYDDDATLLLYDYVITHVLPKVEIYDHQVCSHGRNTASMAQKKLGYSGSLDNPNIAPPDTTLLLEKGTNGQTVDLTIRQNDEWWVVESARSGETCSLFTDVMEKHPDRAEIRAIIDVGAYFRGIHNKKVAEMICGSLRRQNSPIAGVLFYDPLSGALHFMNKNQPAHPIRLSGTRPEIIQKETGYTPDLRFTYYDQNHITGSDILQYKTTKAIITWSEHTKLHDSIQGEKRLRELDQQQRTISVTEKGALNKIGAKIRKPSLENLEIGRVDPKRNSVRDLLLFTHLNEAEGQKDENLLFCLQDITDTLQKYLLDIAYSGSKDKRREIFAKVPHLFEKTLVVDLYLEYAYKREQIPIKDYLTAIQKRFIDSLPSVLAIAEIEGLNQTLSGIIEKAVPGLQKTIEVRKNFDQQEEFTLYGSQNGTTTQFREQKQTAERVTDRVQDKQIQHSLFTNNERDVLKTHKMTDQIPITVKYLEDPSYIQKPSLYTGENDCVKKKSSSFGISLDRDSSDSRPQMEIWALNQALETGVREDYQNLFDPDILMTSNFAIAWQNRIDILGGFSKTSFQWLLVCDEQEGNKEWKILLISVEDAGNLLKNWSTANLPEGRSLYLMRAFSPVKCLKSKGKDFDPGIIEEDPKVRMLIAQAFLFGGKLHSFNDKKWCKTLDDILPKGEERKAYAKFFEERVLGGTPLSYMESPLYEILHKK